eukprot:GHVN01040523.1.p1 GENE.GHVN01040523.1~~GHVN01040523.1.p1  ORF type:complete len:101 (-),score=4.31 GHVN01040523.1:129-431(-)
MVNLNNILDIINNPRLLRRCKTRPPPHKTQNMAPKLEEQYCFRGKFSPQPESPRHSICAASVVGKKVVCVYRSPSFNIRRRYFIESNKISPKKHFTHRRP